MRLAKDWGLKGPIVSIGGLEDGNGGQTKVQSAKRGSCAKAIMKLSLKN